MKEKGKIFLVKIIVHNILNVNQHKIQSDFCARMHNNGTIHAKNIMHYLHWKPI